MWKPVCAKTLRTCLENVVGQASRLPLGRLGPVFSPARRPFIAGRRPAPLLFRHALNRFIHLRGSRRDADCLSSVAKAMADVSAAVLRRVESPRSKGHCAQIELTVAQISLWIGGR